VTWWKKSDSEKSQDNLNQTSNLRTPALNTNIPPMSSLNPAGILDEKAIEERYGQVRSALGEGTVIQGKLSFDTPVRIDGNLSGEIFSTSVLIVGKTGKISANINVDTLVVFGSVSGEVKAKSRIELHKSSELVGNITSPSIVIGDGAYFEGQCRMTAAQAEQKTKAKDTKQEASQKNTTSTLKQSAIKTGVPIVNLGQSQKVNEEKPDLVGKKGEKEANKEAKLSGPALH
jgi:cytoskeletal protein CcmA (bactofilin family)